MSKIFLFCLVIFFLNSCKNFKNIDIDDISRINIEYNTNQPLNYGSNFNGKIVLKMKDRTELDITQHHKLQLNTDVIQVGSRKDELIIVEHPFKFNDSIVNIVYQFNCKKDMVYTQKDSIYLNFYGPLTVNYSGSNGRNGANGKNANSPSIFQDGKTGDPGLNGENGQQGINIHVYIWKEKSRYQILVLDQLTFLKEYYNLKEIDQPKLLTILSNGGNGGNGGTGGDGSKGNDGIINTSKPKNPGYGGTGGNGGNGANGGNGGNIEVFIHNNAIEIEKNIDLSSVSGKGGESGVGGKGGKAGTAMAGQKPVSNGANGTNGWNGMNGQLNGAIQVLIQDFNFENSDLLK